MAVVVRLVAEQEVARVVVVLVATSQLVRKVRAVVVPRSPRKR